MGAPAIVMGDQVQGTCAIHQVPSPTGNPVPGPPMPFAAPLTMGLCQTVLIGGKPAAVLGASGINAQTHVGLHASDPYLAPPMQVGRITSGSPTVTFGGQPAASTTASATCCATPGTLAPGDPTVLVG